MAKWRDSSDEDYILPSKDDDFQKTSKKINIYTDFIDINLIKNILIKILIWILIIENLYLLITLTQQTRLIQQLGYNIFISIKNFFI